ncbi:MAG: L-sorbosone dehydrogenase [Parcubacteria group bacterium Gr01-1014_13]|nr:MAG: L-sorbosone dehydrogenase [Parcubacteria group bacterium Gr01-1014_13]
MKKTVLIIILLLVLAGLGWIGVFYYQNLRGIAPVIFPPSGDISQTVTSTKPTASKPINNGSLKMPDGFAVSIFAKNLPGARVMIADHDGNIWLSQTGQGKVSKLIIKDGSLIKQTTVLSGLKNPHGLAFDPDNSSILFIAEETKISKTTITPTGVGPLEKIIDLPPKGNHFTRTLGFGPDGRLYVSIGSTCNVCHENDPRYASIWSMKKDGSDFKQVARGLRNSVFFVFKDSKMWATEMGRDLLGDDIPPDEINIIDITSPLTLNFGWPNCYGKNIHDDAFDKNTYIRNPCMEPFEKESHIDIPAHSAPLGLAFVSPKAGWPGDYKNDLLVAYHGSWNRSVPTGYKVVRYHLDVSGKVLGVSDFLSGWIKGKAADGRPVDIIFDQNGKMYVSDDKAGVIYQIEYVK